METASGRELTATVAYRIPVEVYSELVKQARAEGVPLSRVLRRATLLGLRIEQGERERDEAG